MRDAFVAKLTELAERDERVIFITADLGFGVFESFSKKLPNQYLNVGVAEQNATGLALEGWKVFVYSIGNFPTLRCLEQIRNDACYHEVNVNIVASGGGFSYGALGMSHHATEDIGILRTLPGTTVVAPGTAWEAGAATEALLNCNGTGYLRLDKSSAKLPDSYCQDDFVLGKARRVREGKDATIIAAGGILEEALIAAADLSSKGIECRVVSMPTIKPIDEKEILSAAEETGGIITLEEHNILCGLGGAVAEVCMEMGCMPGFFKRMGMRDVYSSIVGTQNYLRAHYEIDANSVIKTLQSLLDGGGKNSKQGDFD